MTDYNIYLNDKYIGMISDVSYIKRAGGNVLNIMRSGIISDKLIAILHGTVNENESRINIEV